MYHKWQPLRNRNSVVFVVRSTGNLRDAVRDNPPVSLMGVIASADRIRSSMQLRSYETPGETKKEKIKSGGGYMVAFAGSKYAARSPPALVSDGSHIVTSFTLILEFKQGRLQNLYWKRDGCASCQGNSNIVCLNKQECGIKLSNCKSQGDLSLQLKCFWQSRLKDNVLSVPSPCPHSRKMAWSLRIVLAYLDAPANLAMIGLVAVVVRESVIYDDSQGKSRVESHTLQVGGMKIKGIWGN
ncbi:hypothetical protein KSS87_008858 [Heliosperma pusillum]|nr:hypothetical protein KSS87_014910 [Heliosperma pusillum]KAH9609998.1 hypothetical protein KSS87_008858 [Heliosperma pusillum]